MTPDQWQRIERLFDAALEVSLEGRPAFLERQAPGDRDLQREVRRLLVECKTGEKEPAKDLIAFTHILKPVHSFQLASDESIDRRYAEYGITVQGYERFLSGLV